MGNGKSSVNVKINTDVKEQATQLLGRMGIDQTTAIDMFYRQIIAAALKRNPKQVSLPVDDNGHVIVDKEKHPDIYDWAVNG